MFVWFDKGERSRMAMEDLQLNAQQEERASMVGIEILYVPDSSTTQFLAWYLGYHD